eukprot:gnl/MRDRNA2_/MRDRNA2_96047_c0_seq1.p1 gnl/MRDRNA2_/MRDRNA2_96047_c0~~gnl/MRDRNA2_/MRDRNA2_96047_c0_seq1.p1  ORF type:complete len:365 (-),score=75.23 gnl/MRDRNA2_/MRDRNA2_96047_c0_seq1:41-1135(-)
MSITCIPSKNEVLRRLKELNSANSHRVDGKELEAKITTHIALLESTIKMLAHQNEHAHQNAGDSDSVVFFTKGSDKKFKCSRTLARMWSEPFAALLQHGNSFKGDSPCEIEMQMSPRVFEDVFGFLCHAVQPQDVPSHHAQSHELLEFADCYCLQELKDVISNTMVFKNSISLSNAAQYLKLGVKYSVPTFKTSSADILAAEINNQSHENQIMSLDVHAMHELLGSNELNIKQESDILVKIEKWISQTSSKDGPDTSHVDQLLKSVRLPLFSYEELTDLSRQCTDGYNYHKWSKISQFADKQQLQLRIRDAIDEKLKGIYKTALHKRKHTEMANREEENRAAKMFKVSKCLYSSTFDSPKGGGA